LTSEHVALGPADADAAWMGLRRHQALFALSGLVLVGDGVMNRRPLIEILVGVTALCCVVPVGDGRSVGEWGGVLMGFLARRHWCELNVREFGEDIVCWAGGEVALRGYRLAHHGRLDLAGRDVELAEAVAALVDAASAARGPRHLSQHVHHHRAGASTLMALPADLSPPDGWRLDAQLTLDVLGVGATSTSHYLERFSYVRTTEGPCRVYRVRDFSAVAPSRALLEQLLRARPVADVAVHVEVVSGARAPRIAARAAHKVDSDDALARSVGFRRSAQSARNIERMIQREVLVANGRALIRVAVFVIVRANSFELLHQRSAEVWRHAHDAGLRLERGRGVQGRWYAAQLPGGMSW
jgi:hypothetical protein